MPNFSRFLICGAALLWAVSGVASAQELKPLPELGAKFNLVAYAGKTDTVERTIDNIPDLAFKISLPKTWVERTTLGQEFGELIRFDGPPYGEVRPYFSFRRLQMNRENSAKNELVSYLLASGYTLRSIKDVDDRNVEAMYVVQDKNGDSFAVRTVARIIGPSLVLAEYALPISVWGDVNDEQTFAIQSFKFTQDSDDPIEKRIERTYHESLRFFYPASWVFEGEKSDKPNYTIISLSNPGMSATKNGQVRLGLYATKSLIEPMDHAYYPVDVPQLLKDVKARYVAMGLEVGKSIDTRHPDLNLPVGFSAMDVYELREKRSDYDLSVKAPVTSELWVAVFQSKEELPRTFIVELMTPARQQDIYLWSVNTRAFEIILKSIQ